MLKKIIKLALAILIVRWVLKLLGVDVDDIVEKGVTKIKKTYNKILGDGEEE